jgi:hypothetical protein
VEQTSNTVTCGQAAVHPAGENDCWLANLENEKAQANILKLKKY